MRHSNGKYALAKDIGQQMPTTLSWAARLRPSSGQLACSFDDHVRLRLFVLDYQSSMSQTEI